MLSKSTKHSPSESFCTKNVNLFQKALASYIRKYAYSNANMEDLWDLLEAETGEQFKDTMSAWTKKLGYPVINVKLEGKGIQLEQVINLQVHFVLHSSKC
jgi:aminopeptidase N